MSAGHDHRERLLGSFGRATEKAARERAPVLAGQLERCVEVILRLSRFVRMTPCEGAICRAVRVLTYSSLFRLYVRSDEGEQHLEPVECRRVRVIVWDRGL